MKKTISVLIAIIILGVIFIGFSACSSNITGYTVIKRELNGKTIDVKNARTFPKPQQPTSKNIDYIEMDGRPYGDLFMTLSLQGNVNRIQPSIYVVSSQIIEGPKDYSASQYWLDKLDETYTGKDAFIKNKISDPYEMVKKYSGKIKGYILYNPRLTDKDMVSIQNYSDRYADIAVLNLTIMMCSYYEAIALTQAQVDLLKDKYAVNLKQLGDTNAFMEKNPDGSISANRGSHVVWKNVYEYTLKNLAPNLTHTIIAHNPGFQAPCFDLYISSKCVVYNRIFNAQANEEELQMEKRILNTAKNNAIACGVWYLQQDEHSYVSALTESGKLSMVTYETFNLSWSCGLPVEKLPVKEKDIVLDGSKIYIAFDNTEGDNNSHTFFTMNKMFDDKNRGLYPFGWTLTPVTFEASPNMIKYYAQNWKKTDALVCAESGLEYTDGAPTGANSDEFFALTDEYLKRIGTSSIRMLSSDIVDPLIYAEKLKNLNTMLLGYNSLAINMFNNNKDANIMYKDTVFFRNYDGTNIKNLYKVEPGTPAFYSISLMGWGQTPSSVVDIVKNLDDRFVVVTPNQLSNLYKQYYGKEFKNINHANFVPIVTREEMGFLYKASNHRNVDTIEQARFAKGQDYFIYKFNFDKNVKSGKMNLLLSGDYQVEVSTDYLNWYVVAKNAKTSTMKDNLSVDLSKFISKSKDIYVRFGNSSNQEDVTSYLYNLNITTDKTALRSLTISPDKDAAYLINGNRSVLNEQGRKGEFIYKFDIAKDIQSGDISLNCIGNAQMQISNDNKKFIVVKLVSQGNSKYAKLDDLKGTIYVKLISDSEISRIMFNEKPKTIKELSFAPINSDTENKYLISSDPTETLDVGYNTRKIVTGNNALIYRFTTGNGINSTILNLKINGKYTIAISNDGENYTVIKSVFNSENESLNQSIDISKYAKNKTVYIKFTSNQEAENSSFELYNFAVSTNLSSPAFMKRLQRYKGTN
jgi:hypothetical protein